MSMYTICIKHLKQCPDMEKISLFSHFLLSFILQVLLFAVLSSISEPCFCPWPGTLELPFFLVWCCHCNRCQQRGKCEEGLISLFTHFSCCYTLCNYPVLWMSWKIMSKAKYIDWVLYVTLPTSKSIKCSLQIVSSWTPPSSTLHREDPILLTPPQVLVLQLPHVG